MSAQAKLDKHGQVNEALKITQLRSTIGFDRKQALAMRGLGLRRIRHTVERAGHAGDARPDPEGSASRESGR